MAETSYKYTKDPVDTNLLNTQIIADVGQTPTSLQYDRDGGADNLIIWFADALTGQEQTDLGTTVTDHVAPPLGDVARITKSAQEIGVDRAGRAFLASNEVFFVSFAGSGQPDDAGVGFIVPDDYTGGGDIAIGWTNDSSNTSQWRLECDILVKTPNSGSAYSTAEEQLVFLDTMQATVLLPRETAFKALATTIKAGDFVNVELLRDPAHVDDTANVTLFVAYVTFRYTKG